ncbi:MAG TPA: Lrp/AsnC family transcriptional regulator, partial [Candidatus Bathyarchaeia archaeon]|nr:Lrp/AsnC family transcriptional regulator [Candidatus Bathyarchaeia archaeon]
NGVTEVLTFLGGVFVVYVAYRNQAQLEEILRNVGSIEGIADLDYEVSPKTESPIKFTVNDWNLVRCLNHQARREIVKVAREVGLSSRTVQRRLQSLVKDGAIRFGIQVDISKAQDLFPYIIFIKLQPGTSKPSILSKIKEVVPNIWRTLRSVNPLLSTLASCAERLSDLERDVESIRTTRGVQTVSVVFNTSDLTNDRWIDLAIREASRRVR